MKRMITSLLVLTFAAGCAGAGTERGAPADTVLEAPAEAVMESPPEAVIESPPEVVVDAPAEAPADAPGESSGSPAAAPADNAAEDSADAREGASAVTKTDFVATDPASVVLAAGKPQLVEFYATWCITCRAQMPIVHGLEAEFGSQVNFVYVDIDDPASADLKKALGYKHQPDYYLLDGDGNVVTSWLGTLEATEVRSAINGVLGG